MKGDEKDMQNQNFARLADGAPGRFCVDAADLQFVLRPSEAALNEIQRLEEASLTAEQRLGNFRVG